MEVTSIKVMPLIESPSALTREQGNLLYEKIISELQQGKRVELDFQDIESIITPFLNVSIGKLYERYSSEELRELLSIKNRPEGTTSKFQTVINNAKAYYTNKEVVEKTVQEVVNN